MESLTFDTVNMSWNNLRMSGSPQLRSMGIDDISQILVQRVGEDDRSITVMFHGFERALEDPEREAPMVKRFIFGWIKRFAQAQIARGEAGTFILRLTKPVPSSPLENTHTVQATPSKVSESLTHISKVRKLHGY